jgi:plastocyanin
MMRRVSNLGGVVAVLMMAGACGGGSSAGGGSTPITPSPSPAPGGSATITISNNAVSPRTVTISAGQRVTFVNSDNRAHDMASDPHPEHTACPAINDVGFLQQGQSRTTGNLNTARTCGFHDHNQPSVAGLTGTIVIQ